MTQLLPDKEKQRPLAYMLLVIVVILTYWFGFHWFFQAHAACTAQSSASR